MARKHIKTEPDNKPLPLKSSASRNMAFVTFLNLTERKVDVIWMNYEGQGIKYKTLDPTQRVDVNTFEGHPWMFRDSYSGDKLVVEQKEIFSPKASFHTDERSGWILRHHRKEVEINLPVYTLKTRAMQVARSVLSPSIIKTLSLPQELIEDLLCTPK